MSMHTQDYLNLIEGLAPETVTLIESIIIKIFGKKEVLSPVAQEAVNVIAPIIGASAPASKPILDTIVNVVNDLPTT